MCVCNCLQLCILICNIDNSMSEKNRKIDNFTISQRSILTHGAHLLGLGGRAPPQYHPPGRFLWLAQNRWMDLELFENP